ncbi:MAG: L-glutamine:2-deoxy-scyllo-inosose aminotransferase [Planctomycetes bacterium ADurb.Bin412]|nr:MAG: L-glutamine:2-deoxy-scyllo-inosose aminotransferase [Planctomycetes bacterium ADurb.Bin412]
MATKTTSRNSNATEKLAIDGGEKTIDQLGPFPTKIGKEELLEVLDLWQLSAGNMEKIRDIINSDPRLKGPHLFRYYNPRPSKVAAAEKAMKEWIGSSYCMATNSCTSALVAAYRSLGIGMGDEVIVPAYTFFATAATVAASNAIPVIVDVDDTLCMDARAAEKAITRRTKAIVPVHMRGAPAQMDALMEVANKHGIPVVEDVAQAAGGSFQGKMLGSIGKIGCFSFDYYKIIVSGEGGFYTTDNERLYTRALNWHDCAACWRPDRFGPEKENEDLFCGENYRMNELDGAVALAQIHKAGSILAGHRAAKQKIKDAIEKRNGLSFRRLTDAAGDTGICLILYLPDAGITQTILSALKAEGVPCGGIYDSKVRDWHTFNYWEHILQYKSVSPDRLPWSGVPQHELPKYTKDMCPKSLELLSRAILIDIDCHLQTEDCDKIAAAINKVLRAYL